MSSKSKTTLVNSNFLLVRHFTNLHDCININYYYYNNLLTDNALKNSSWWEFVIVFDRKIWSDIVRWSTFISSTVHGGKVTSYLLSISIFKTLPLKRSKFFLLPQIYVQDSLEFTENQRFKKNIGAMLINHHWLRSIQQHQLWKSDPPYFLFCVLWATFCFIVLFPGLIGNYFLEWFKNRSSKVMH